MMGDLPGHVGPGLAYFAWAVVWLLALRRRGGTALWQPWSTEPDNDLASDSAATAPWESWAKLIIPGIEMAFEFRWVRLPMSATGASTLGHITSDIAVMLSASADMLVRRSALPRGADRIALAFAFFVPGLLFVTHGQHGPIASTAHLIFGRLLLLVSAFIVAEMFRPAPLLRWLRIGAVALAGAWFVHTGWMLYVSGMDLMSAEHVPRVYLWFTWYAVAIMVALAAAALPGARIKHQAPSTKRS
jgi:hypothetical protein